MSDFWNNISRYPRFFISSLVGSVLVIIAPLRNLFKVQKFRIILPVLFFLFSITLYTVIAGMTGQ
jgi:hypothetical protein